MVVAKLLRIGAWDPVVDEDRGRVSWVCGSLWVGEAVHRSVAVYVKSARLTVAKRFRWR